MSVVVDKFLLEDFFEFLVENYDLKSAKVRWITHGTRAGHSLEHYVTKEVKLIADIAEEYAKEKGFESLNAFNSVFLNGK